MRMKPGAALVALTLVAIVVWVVCVRPAMRDSRIRARLREVATTGQVPGDHFVAGIAREGPKAVPILLAALDDDEIAVRLTALRALGDILGESILLSRTMNCATGIVFGQREAKDTIDVLVPVIVTQLNSPDARIRRAALEVLIQPIDPTWLCWSEESPRVVAALERLRRDDDVGVREAAVSVTAFTAPEKVLKRLLPATDDSDDSVRSAARLGVLWVLPAQDVADDLSYEEKQKTIRAIASLSVYEPTGEELYRWDFVKDADELSAQALKKLHALNVSTLRPLLVDRNVAVRVGAARSLFLLGDREAAIVALIAMVRYQTHGGEEAAKVLARPEIRHHDATKKAMSDLQEEDHATWERITKYDESTRANSENGKPLLNRNSQSTH